MSKSPGTVAATLGTDRRNKVAEVAADFVVKSIEDCDEDVFLYEILDHHFPEVYDRDIGDEIKALEDQFLADVKRGKEMALEGLFLIGPSSLGAPDCELVSQ